MPDDRPRAFGYQRDHRIAGTSEVVDQPGLCSTREGKPMEFADPVTVVRALTAYGYIGGGHRYSAGRRPPWGGP